MVNPTATSEASETLETEAVEVETTVLSVVEETTTEADAAQAEEEEAEAEAEETKEDAQSKYLTFVRVWQTSKNTKEVAERLSTPDKPMKVATAQARASKYRANEYELENRKTKDGKPLYVSIKEKEECTPEKANAKVIGGKGPNAGKVIFATMRKLKDGQPIITRRGINLKHMPKGGGRQLDVGAAEALIAELAKEG